MRRSRLLTLLGAAFASPTRLGASSDALVWYAADLDGPRRLGHDENRVLPAASIIKLLITLALIEQAATDRFGLDKRIMIHVDDRVGGSDRFGSAAPGSYPAGALISAMLSLSDNTAANALLREAGMERCNLRAADLGLPRTRIRRRFYDWEAQRRGLENVTTPRESAEMLVYVASDALVVGPRGDVARFAMRALLAQSDRETIPAALPQRHEIANKTGELPGVRNDVAIVGYSEARPYVIAVMDRYDTSRAAAVQQIRTVVQSVDRNF